MKGAGVGKSRGEGGDRERERHSFMCDLSVTPGSFLPEEESHFTHIH